MSLFKSKINSNILQQQYQQTFTALTLVELSRGISCISDGIMTSRLVGTEELAAFGIVAPYFSIVAIISIFLTINCQTIYTRNLGKGNLNSANSFLSYALLYGAILSAIVTVLGVIFSEKICYIFGARGESALLMPYAKDYFIGLLIGTIFNVMLATLSPIIELDGGGKWVKSANLLMVIVNIIGNYVTTKFMNLGLLGIGISSSAGFFVAVLILCGHFFEKKCQIRFFLDKKNKTHLIDFFKIGYMGAISMLCRTLCPIVVNGIIIAMASSDGLSAISAKENIKFVIGAPIVGIAGAMMELGSISFGERDKITLKKLLKISLKYTLIGGTLFAMLIFAGAPLFSACYFTKDTSTFSLGTNAIRCYALSLPFIAFNSVVISYLEVIKKKVPLLIMYVMTEFLSVAICSAILGNLLGFKGILIAIPLGPALITLICIAFYIYTLKNNSDSSIPFVPKEFGVSAENCLYLTVHTMETVIDASAQVQQFCTARGICQKKSVSSAILIEELAGNVIKHGFTDVANQQIDIRIAVDGENVIIKLTDNCRRFDFEKYVQLMRENTDNPEKNLGLKLALGLTQNIAYLNITNNNILVMTI